MHCTVRHEQPPAYPDAHVVDCIHSPWKGKARSDPRDQFWPCRHWCSCVGFPEFCWGTYGGCRPEIWREQRLVQTALGRCCFCCQTSAPLPPPARSKRQRANWQQPLVLAISISLPSSVKLLHDFRSDIRLFGATAASPWTSAVLRSSSRGQQAMWWHLFPGCQLLQAWNNGTKNNGKRTVHNNTSSIVLDSLWLR